MDRNCLRGVERDRFNVILSAVEMNFHKLLGWAAAFYVGFSADFYFCTLKEQQRCPSRAKGTIVNSLSRSSMTSSTSTRKSSFETQE
jgi:hypothetical protein